MENRTITNKDKFLDLYSKIFDKNGDTVACGRENCKELIITASKIDDKLDYGNKDTGIMNITNLKDLYTKINE